MFGWLRSNWKPVAAVSVVAIAATSVGVLWPGKPDPNFARPLLVGLKQDSRTYLGRHAQADMAAPAGSTAWIRCGMTEAAGNLSCTTEGAAETLVANGTPVYQLYTPIPRTDGLTKKAIGFLGTEWFAHAGNAIADQTTNSFTVKLWWCNSTVPAANAHLVSKLTGNTGYSVYLDTTNRLNISIGDGVLASGLVSAALSLACHRATVVFDRAGTAKAEIDGVDTGVTVDISARSGSITSAVPFTIGRLASGGSAFIGRVAEVVVGNASETLATAIAGYTAFKVPAGITYTQTTTRCYEHGTEAGFGERLGCYGGSTTAPQWPMAIRSSAVSASRNPLGTVYPSYQATTNILGYSRELNLWNTLGGSTVVANNLEAPDGSMTADTVTLPAGGYVFRAAVVPGGNSVAGVSYCTSIYMKKISGTSCAAIRIYYTGSDLATTLNLTNTEWARYSYCNIDSTPGTALSYWIGGDAGGTCVIGMADAQYELGNVTPPCTTTAGAVSQTCNQPTTTANWSTISALMPSSIDRGEMIARTSLAPWTQTAGYKRVIGQTGDSRIALFDGQFPSLVMRSQGGAVEGVARGKPIQHTEVSREHIASWDTNVAYGLTNTNPRRYAALSIDGAYQQTVLAPRTSDSITLQTKTGTATTQVYIGGDASTNALNGGLESFELYGRPAQVIRSAQADQIAVVDTTGAGYIANASTPQLCDHSFGVASVNRWCWPQTELSGSLYDVVNGVTLPAVGTPFYQLNSGLLAKGQGRRGVGFNYATIDKVCASSNATLSIGTNTEWTVHVLATPLIRQTADVYHVAGVSTQAAMAGWSIQPYSNGTLYVYLNDGTNRRYASIAGVVATGKTAMYSSTWTKTAGTWNDPIIRINGADVTEVPAGVAPTGNIVNGGAACIAAVSSGAGTYNGAIYEVLVSNRSYSTAEVLAMYQRSIQTGEYWETDANTVAHYKMDDGVVTNGIGLKDSTTNANHLTVVTGAPTPYYRTAPYPMGTGVSRGAVASASNSNYFSVADPGTVIPDNAQSFSVAAWFRVVTHLAATRTLISKVGAADGWALELPSSTFRFRFITNEGGSAATISLLNVNDGLWHLGAAKVVYSGGTYTPYTSIDGSPFVYNAGTTTTGDPTTNNGPVLSLYSPGAGTEFQMAGASVWKNYALSDADVLTLYGSQDPTGGLLTYARTATTVRGACYETHSDPLLGVGLRCFDDNQVPYQWRSEHESVAGNVIGLGLPRNSAVTNLALESFDATTTWTNNNTTDAADTTLAPDGSTTADTITATAGAGDLRQVFAAIAAVPSTYCQYLKRNSATTDTAGFVRMVTNSTGVQIAQTAFTATTTWQRFCVSGTPTLNDTRIETQITTNGQSVYWWGASLTALAGWPGVYCPTTTVSTTCNSPTSEYIAAANISTWDRTQGVISSIGYTGSTTGYLFDLHNGASLNGAIRLLAPTTEAYIYNNAGVLQQRWGLPNAQAGVLTGATMVFDSTGAFYNTTRRAYGQTRQSGFAGAWDTYTTDTAANWTPATGTNLHLGAVYDGTLPIEGAHLITTIHGTR